MTLDQICQIIAAFSYLLGFLGCALLLIASYENTRH